MSVNEKMTAIANKLRECGYPGNRDKKYTLDSMVQGVQDVYDEAFFVGQADGREEGKDWYIEQGKQAEYDRFWDSVQQNGTRTEYTRWFCGRAWTDETFNPKHNMQPTTAREMFQHSMITNGEVIRKIDFSKSDTGRNTFAQTAFVNLPALDFSNATTLYDCFNAASRLQSIELLTVSEKCTNFNTVFSGCTKLEEIRFGGVIAKTISFSQSNLLSQESVQSIIDHLKDLTGATAQTLTLHATVGAKLTDAQKATISAKNWTLAY